MIKKIFASLLSVLFTLLLLASPVSARESIIPTDELYDALPDEAAQTLDENGISPAGGTQNITPGDLISWISGLAADCVGKPAAMFASVTAVIMLASLIGGIAPASAAAGGVGGTVSAVCACAVICVYLSDIISMCEQVFSTAADFMLVYIPVIAGVTAASGSVSSAAVFGTAAAAGIQILARAVSSLIIPLTGCILGISAAGSLDRELGLDRLCEGIKKLTVWGLGLITTLFLALLSVQTAISASADSALLRTARFAASSAVPIVGGAVSEALSSVSGSLAVIRSGTGGFGIAAGAVMIAPAAVSAVCCRLFLFLSGIVSDLMGCDGAGRMIRAGENVMSVIIASLVCLMMFVTVSTAMLLTVCH